MSSLSKKVDVLVIGAGPTGLLTALELARAGIEVEVVDRAWRAAAQSYACGLHASTLEMLARLELERPLLAAGLRTDSVGFYQGSDRCAELRIDQLESEFPFLLVLPQYQLEEALVDQLRARGVQVRWGHRLDDLTQDENSVTATVEQLAVTSLGYPYARSEETVERSFEVRAKYLVGADGCRSHVRQILGIPTERLGKTTAFEVFEYEPASDAGAEVRVVIGDKLTDSFWPQPGCLCRWSLQLESSEARHPEKERSAFVIQDELSAASNQSEIAGRIQARAPWYQAGIRELEWTTTVAFERIKAGRFGAGRCWLTGDSGHQTSPVGMQSMNVGLREAADLADRLAGLVRQVSRDEVLAEYEASRQAEWRRLLGTGNGSAVLAPGPRASAWTRGHASQLAECLPGSGAEFVALAAQLGLEPA